MTYPECKGRNLRNRLLIPKKSLTSQNFPEISRKNLLFVKEWKPMFEHINVIQSLNRLIDAAVDCLI